VQDPSWVAGHLNLFFRGCRLPLVSHNLLRFLSLRLFVGIKSREGDCWSLPFESEGLVPIFGFCPVEAEEEEEKEEEKARN
jgi:hypothetical protein